MLRLHLLTVLAIAVMLPLSLAAATADTPPANPDRAPLSDSVQQGLAWLAAQQLEGGGWGQGMESAGMRGGQRPQNQPDALHGTPNVADTAMAALALHRAGSTPTAGPYHQHITAAVHFICDQIEKADGTSLFVTDLRGTRLQQKIGPYVDTFLAALLLAEVKDKMPDTAGNDRVLAALNKTLNKIQRHQQEDGGWGGRAWAAGLGGSLGVKALNRAAQVGVDVDETVRLRAMNAATQQGRPNAEGRFAAGDRAAGIELYAAAESVGKQQDSVNTNRGKAEQVREQMDQAQQQIAALEEEVDAAGPAAAPELRTRLESERRNLEQNEQTMATFRRAEGDLAQARQAVLQRMEDPEFVAGFGNNGGEEYLSYMQIGESLVVEGGENFQQWNAKMTNNLERIQNQDGSWSGHHCITGRTFCTSAALMVLTVDRATVPLAAKIETGESIEPEAADDR